MLALYSVVGGLVVAVAALVVLVWRLNVSIAKLMAWAIATDRRVEDFEVSMGAIRDDLAALDESVAELSDDVEAIKENPLGPPVEEGAESEDE